MNPRILELQHQAMSLVLNGNDPDGDVEKMYIPAEFTKKLAELIVRECVKSCEQVAADADAMAKSDFVTDAGRMLHQGAGGGAMNCSAEIKKLLES
jgi:hypothetical protein